MDYQRLTQNNNMNIIIKELNKSLSGIDESNEAINNIVIKHLIINPVESFYETSENKMGDSILSGLREYQMSRRKRVKCEPFQVLP